MDRDRLKEIHQTDVTESKVNQDFVDWLKTSGPTWLLVILVAVVAYVGMIRWRGYQANQQNEAWAALMELNRGLPLEYEDVATEHGDTDGIGVIARLLAAERHMNALQMNRPLSAASNSQDPMTEAQREVSLDAADRLYDELLTLVDKDYPGRAGDLHRAAALFGKAAVAEARGNADVARGFYEQVKSGPGERFASYAAQAQHRIDTLEQSIIALDLAPPLDVNQPRRKTSIPPTADPVLQDLINGPPPGSGDDASASAAAGNNVSGE